MFSVHTLPRPTAESRLNRVRIYIATTKGPVEIQRLAKEDPEVRSVVCLNGTCEALPISPGYDAFVRKPTGIIERLFGHPVYRMDVSHRIGEGRSWQLGALAAHALKAEGKLASKDEQTDHILWITGEVDHELKVHPVEHVPDKLQQSAVLFEQAISQQQPLTLIVPAANRKNVKDEQLPKDVEILAIENSAELFQMLRLETSGNRAQSSSARIAAERDASEASSAKHTKRTSMVAGGLALAVVIAVAGFLFHDRAPKESRHVNATGIVPITIVADKESHHADATEVAPVTIIAEKELRLADATEVAPVTIVADLAPPELTLYELRAPQDSNCAAVRFGKVDPVQLEITPAASKNYQSDRLDRLCGLKFRLLSPDKNTQLKIDTRFIKGDKYFKNSKLFALASQIQQAPEANWRVIFPRRLRQGFQYEITVGSNSKDFKPILHFGD